MASVTGILAIVYIADVTVELVVKYSLLACMLSPVFSSLSLWLLVSKSIFQVTRQL